MTSHSVPDGDPESQRVRLALQKLASSADRPSRDEVCAAVARIIDGQAGEVEIAALLTAWAAGRLTHEQLAGVVQAVRGRMIPLDVPTHLRPLFDTCGTGGDGLETVNLSTAVAIVLAACGVRVAKHGNRSATGRSGSSDVLTELGVRADAPPAVILRCLQDVGIAYLHAPNFHPALRHVAAVRKQLPFPTVFNLIGPLVNPCRPEFQLIGVNRRGLELIADTLAEFSRDPNDASWPRRFALVSGEDGLDEVSLSASTRVAFQTEQGTARGRIEPSEFGLPGVAVNALRIQSPAESAAAIRSTLRGDRTPVRDVVLANVAVALWVAGRIGRDELKDGVAMAQAAIDSSRARELLDRWCVLSHQDQW